MMLQQATPSQLRFIAEKKARDARFAAASISAKIERREIFERLTLRAERERRLRAQQIAQAHVQEQKRAEAEHLAAETSRLTKAVSLATVNVQIACYYGVSLDDLKGPSRISAVVRPRQVAYYLGRKIALKSYPLVCRALGNRDHTSGISGYRRIEMALRTDAELRSEISALIQIIEGL